MRLLITLVTGFFIAFFVSQNAGAHEPITTQDHIGVVGVGEIAKEPDQAILEISVSAQQSSLPAAKALADERYRSVLAVLKEAQIDDHQIKATQVIAQPQYEWRSSKRVYKGELVARTLRITIDDLSKVSPLMQALVENDVSTINGLTTGFKDRAALLQQALAAAADNAKDKAKFLAERLGRDLGSAFLITEYNEDAPQVFQADTMARSRAMGAESAPPQEMFGTQKVRARINVSFNLL